LFTPVGSRLFKSTALKAVLLIQKLWARFWSWWLSQTHRMAGAGRDLCGASSPTPPLKQGHLQQAAQDLVQGGLEYLQRRRLHSLPGQPVPVLRHPQSEEVLPHVQTNFLCFSLCPLPLVLSLGTTEKSLAPSS